MTASLFDLAIKDACDRAFAKMIAPGGWLRERLRRDVGWTLQGFEPGFGIKDRERFTETVADRIHDKAREKLTLFGFSLWLARWPIERCAKMAEEIVTNWLADERMKFGDRRFCWTDGHDLADEEMSNWEAA